MDAVNENFAQKGMFLTNA